MTALPRTGFDDRPGLRAPLPAVSAHLPVVDLLVVPVAGPVPHRDGPGPRVVRLDLGRRRRSAACPTWPSWRRACWPPPRCSRPRSRRPSRSWAAWSGTRSSTRCTRRRSRRATSPWATSPGSTARLTFITTVFTAVIVLFGAAASPLVVLAIPAAVLTGLAFAAPIAAFSATQRTPDRFSNIFRFGITPLFLFSGTFFPLTSLPAFLQPLAWLTPLYHGVALTRGLSLGTIVSDPVFAVVHLVALLAFIAARHLGAAHRPWNAGWCADDRPDPAHPPGRPRVRQPAVGAPDRAQPVRLPARLAGDPVGVLRAAVLPARDRLRARLADRDHQRPGRPADQLPAVRGAGAARRPPR